MSYVTLADLGRRGGGWRGGGWRSGGRRRWGGGPWYGGPWYDTAVYPAPMVVIDPVDPQSEAEVKKAKEVQEQAKIQAIVAAVREELAKKDGKGLGQSGHFIDVMGPGARDSEIDVVAKDTDVIDEFVPAQQALLMRQQQGLVGLGDQTTSPSVSSSGNCALWAGLSIIVGATVGYAVGSGCWNGKQAV